MVVSNQIALSKRRTSGFFHRVRGSVSKVSADFLGLMVGESRQRLLTPTLGLHLKVSK